MTRDLCPRRVLTSGCRWASESACTWPDGGERGADLPSSPAPTASRPAAHTIAFSCLCPDFPLHFGDGETEAQSDRMPFARTRAEPQVTSRASPMPVARRPSFNQEFGSCDNLQEPKQICADKSQSQNWSPRALPRGVEQPVPPCPGGTRAPAAASGCSKQLPSPGPCPPSPGAEAGPHVQTDCSIEMVPPNVHFLQDPETLSISLRNR